MRFKATLLAGLGFAAIVSIALAQQPGVNSNLAAVYAIPLDSTKWTYAASVTGLSPQAGATDIMTICGSATRVIRVTKAVFSGRATTVAPVDVQFLRRSTANTGGTSSAVTPANMDSANPAVSASVLTFTVNPTLGTTQGNVIDSRQVYLGNLTTSLGTALPQVSFGDRPAQAVVLRGIAQCFAINMAGGTFGANAIDAGFEWTEE